MRVRLDPGAELTGSDLTPNRRRPAIRHWTDDTDDAADAFFSTLSNAEIRRRQDLCNQQMVIAHRERKTDALEDLQRMEAALIRAMFARL